LKPFIMMTPNRLVYDPLEKFVGTWATEGTIPASDTTAEINISGTDTYEWLPGKFFLMHKVDVTMGNDRNETLEIIGFDSKKQVYTMQHYDHKGNSGVMTAYYKDGVWSFLGEHLRFTGGFKNHDNEFSGIWEQKFDGKNWT